MHRAGVGGDCAATEDGPSARTRLDVAIGQQIRTDGGAVADRHDVRLDRVLRRIGREAGGHDAFEEGSGRAFAVVPTDAKDDRALQVQRRVSARGRQRPVVVGLEAARVRIGVPDRVRRRVHLDHSGDERAVPTGVVRIGPVATGEEPVFEVGHDPRSGTDTLARHDEPEPAQRPEVHGSHVPVAVVVVVRLRVAVVEAAAAVHVTTGGHHVDALRPASGCDPRGPVVPVADAGRDEDAVHLVPAGGYRQRARVGEGVRSAGRPAARCLGEVVSPRRLVIDDGDHAGRTSAEGVLGGRVGEAAGAQGSDVGCRVVPCAPDLVQPPAVGAEERPRRAVRGDAWRSARSVDVAGSGHRGQGIVPIHAHLNQTHTDQQGEHRCQPPGEFPDGEYSGRTHDGLLPGRRTVTAAAGSRRRPVVIPCGSKGIRCRTPGGIGAWSPPRIGLHSAMGAPRRDPCWSRTPVRQCTATGAEPGRRRAPADRWVQPVTGRGASPTLMWTVM